MKRFIVAAALALAAANSASAAQITYIAYLNGPSESPANNSPGTGFVTLIIDTTLHTASYNATFTGLTGTTTAAHVHCCTTTPGTGTAGVATTTPSFNLFPLGVTAGSFVETYDLTLASSYRAGFITANGGTTASAEAVLLAGLAAGQAYFNIHTSTFGGGEIRGFLTVPEPASVALVALGLVGLFVQRRRVD